MRCAPSVKRDTPRVGRTCAGTSLLPIQPTHSLIVPRANGSFDMRNLPQPSMDDGLEIMMSIHRKPTLTLWILKRLGFLSSSSHLPASSASLFLISAFDFLITWGVFFVLSAAVLDTQNGWLRLLMTTAGASVCYGLLLAFSVGKRSQDHRRSR